MSGSSFTVIDYGFTFGGGGDCIEDTRDGEATAYAVLFAGKISVVTETYGILMSSDKVILNVSSENTRDGEATIIET